MSQVAPHCDILQHLQQLKRQRLIMGAMKGTA